MTIFNYLAFCSSDPCSSPEGLPHERRKKPSFLARKTRCSWRKKKKTKREMRRYHHHHQEPIMADSISTEISLQEWFAKSPSVRNKRICNNDDDDDGEDYCGSKLKHGGDSVSYSGGQCSSVSLETLLNSSEFNTSSMETSDSRDLSLSLEKLLMMRKNVVEVGLYSFAKSKSMSRERKVSFRLPEASDIIILNSPER